MNVAQATPRLAPPHDPFTLLLTRSDRWRGAGPPWQTGLSSETPLVALELDRLAPIGPDALGPLGTLGGMLLPAFVALTDDEAVYLLDRKGRRLLWFDRCTCKFEPLPCLADDTHDPRAMTAPAAIAANRVALAIAGTNGALGRIVVLQRATLSIVSVINGDFAPSAIAISHARIAVADRKTGDVIAFDYDGHRRGRLAGVGAVDTLTACADGQWLAVTAQDIRRIDADFEKMEIVATPEQAKSMVHKLPFDVDGLGRLNLARFCLCGEPAVALFDDAGQPLAGSPAPHLAPRYATRGRHATEPLDCGLDDCQWHRVRFWAQLPDKTRVSVRTRNAALDFPNDMTLPETEPGWSAVQTFDGVADGEFECLVVSQPGRWLWLELILESDGTDTPRVTKIALEYPRISLARFLPAALTADVSSADLTHRLLAIFDAGFRRIERAIDRAPRLYDARTTPTKFLDWLASWVGVGLNSSMRESEKRRLLRALPRLFSRRGTLDGLEETLATIMGFADLDCPSRPRHCGPRCAPQAPIPHQRPRLVLEHWRLRRWLFLGRGRLGVASQLWGEGILKRTRVGGGEPLGSTMIKLERDPLRDPFHAYAHRFSVFLPAARASNAAMRKRIETLVRLEAPAHTEAEIHWVKPNLTLGSQSTLGFDTVLGACAATRFGDGKLGDASALSGPSLPGMGLVLDRSSSIGRNARLGVSGRI
jgi:phage tail-like protein